MATVMTCRIVQSNTMQFNIFNDNNISRKITKLQWSMFVQYFYKWISKCKFTAHTKFFLGQ